MIEGGLLQTSFDAGDAVDLGVDIPHHLGRLDHAPTDLDGLLEARPHVTDRRDVTAGLDDGGRPLANVDFLGMLDGPSCQGDRFFGGMKMGRMTGAVEEGRSRPGIVTGFRQQQGTLHGHRGMAGPPGIGQPFGHAAREIQAS